MTQPPVIVGLGETLWDCFSDRRCLGGAPLNFACSAAELAQGDADVLLASSVGNDQLGSEAIVATRQHRVNTSAIQRSDRPTGRVSIELDDARVPSYRFEEDAAWDRIRWNDKLLCLAKVCNAVCFGSLGQRSTQSRQTIQRFVGSTPGNSIRVFDINLRPPFVDESVIDESLRFANVLKLNEDELSVLGATYDFAGDDASILKSLAQRFELDVVALTQGSAGSLLMMKDAMSVSSGQAVDVVDTVGAGDAFTAALVLGLLSGWTADEINHRATSVAAYACTQPGATMAFPESLRIG